MNDTSAVIQVRLGSTRFPGKVLTDILGKPMLWYLIERLKASQSLDNIILAMPDTRANNLLQEFAKKNNISYFMGSEYDVLDRYYQAIRKFKVKTIVRICADCPLADPRIVDEVIRLHQKEGNDYTSNTIERSFPRGLDVEVFELKSFEQVKRYAIKNYEKEHVTAYFYQNPSKFKLSCYRAKGKLNHPGFRLTVDTPEDFILIKNIFSRLYKKGKLFTADDIIDLLEREPNLVEINKNIKQKDLIS